MPRRVKIGIVAFIAFILLLLLTLVGTAFGYRNRFYPGVQIDGLKLGGLSRSDGEKKIQTLYTTYENQKVTILVPDLNQKINLQTGLYPSTSIVTTPKGLGVSFNSKESSDSLWKIGHIYTPLTWLRTAMPAFFKGFSGSASYAISPSLISTFLHDQVLPKVASPVPATLVVQDTQVSIAPAKPGLTIDEKVLTQRISESLDTLSDNVPLFVTAPVSSATSPITQATIQPLADRLNGIGALSVYLTASGVSLHPDKKELLSWYTPVQDPQGQVLLTFQKDTAAKYLTQASTKLDQSKSIDQLVAALTPLSDLGKSLPATSLSVPLTLAPVTQVAVSPGSYTAGLYPGKYIEVNLAEQKLYRFEGQTLEKVYLVSSGKASTPTPTGTYTINGHAKRAFSYMYGLYMPFWMNFLDGEYGIHELPEWPNGYKEGVGHLGTPVSDGCIRLGVGEAEELYNWTPDGTPLVII